MRRLVVTRAASDDLILIWKHIREDSLEAADRVVGAIESAFDRIVRMPGIGHWHRDVENYSFRVYRVFQYLIVYRYDDAEVSILKVVHGARDMRTAAKL